MPTYKFLFVIQILYEHYDEFTLDNLYFVISKYFRDDNDIHLITGIIVNCLSQLKLTKEELKQMIDIKTKLMSEAELELSKKEWENHKINENGKAIK